MRTEERWKSTIQIKIMNQLFTPRLVDDLSRLDLETFNEYNSQFIWSLEKETGKTIRACMLLLGHEKKAYLSCKPITSIFISYDSFINELKSCFDTPGKSEIKVLEKYQKAGVLVLDDIGTTAISDWMYHILYSLINYRYEYLKPTIITSNFSLEQLCEKLQDDRVVSRIARGGEIVEKESYK